MQVSSLIALFLTAVSANPPAPEVCDSEVIQRCLIKFESQVALCAKDDLSCECKLVITRGANCYSACPQEAMTRFIQTYGDGKCANYDPYLSRRSNVDDITIVTEQPDLSDYDGDEDGDEDQNDPSMPYTPQIKDDKNRPETESEFETGNVPAISVPEVRKSESAGPTSSESKTSHISETSESKTSHILEASESKTNTEPFDSSEEPIQTSSSLITVDPVFVSYDASPSMLAKTQKSKQPSRHTITMLNSRGSDAILPASETIAPARGKAVTITANDPTSTISLSPQEYRSKLEKSREKAILRSIRSERAAISKQAAERFNYNAAETSLDPTSTIPKNKVASSTTAEEPLASSSAATSSDHLSEILSQKAKTESGAAQLLISRLLFVALGAAWVLL